MREIQLTVSMFFFFFTQFLAKSLQAISNDCSACFLFFFQFWSAYVPCGAAQLNAVQLSLEQIDVIRRLAEMNAQHLTLVTSVKGERFELSIQRYGF